MTEMQKKTLGMAVLSLVLGCLFIIPLLGMLFSLLAIIFGIIALVKISNNKETLKGNGLAIGGIALGALGIVIIPILALLAAIAIPNLIRARLATNEAAAKATVTTLSTGIEAYAAGNNGQYPLSVSQLEQAKYIPDGFTKNRLGYTYSLNLDSNGYQIIANPDACMVTGTKVFSVQAKGSLSEKDCQ